MKHPKTLIPILLLLFACNNSADDNLKPVLNNTTEIYSEDSVYCALIMNGNQRILTWKVNQERNILDFDSRLQGRNSNSVPHFYKRSDDYLCLITYSPGPHYTNQIFLPLSNDGVTIYLDKDMEYFDTLNNVVYYLDDLYDDSLIWFRLNLLSELKDSVVIEKSKKCKFGYPWYDSLSIFKDSIIIHTCFDEKSEYVLK